MQGDGLGLIEHGLIAAIGDEIVYAGLASNAPFLEARRTEHCDGRWITPGLIDCHTHLVFAGNRAREFELRLEGASYEEIARSGGGIASTMRATREASEEDLVSGALPRLDALIAEGVTTVEVKSGYGLDHATELRMLRAASKLAERRDVTIAPTYLGMHALPPEYVGDRDAWVTAICEVYLPEVASMGLAEAVDAFCETIGFTPAEVERLFRAAQKLDLPVKLHAEQLSDSRGTELASRYGALSADHLEHVDRSQVEAMAGAGTVATLLPGAYYFMRESKCPPVDDLRDCGVPIALATDCNPGTSPLTSILLAMNMGATLFRLTVEECLLATTRNAAMALGKGKTIGTLAPGYRCDLAIWDIEQPAELVYRIGYNPLHERVWGSK